MGDRVKALAAELAGTFIMVFAGPVVGALAGAGIYELFLRQKGAEKGEC